MLNEQINKFENWFKENKNAITIGFLIILVSTLSFGLGYLSNREFTRAPIIIEKCSNFSN